jgi:hypothetical protein
MYGNACESAVVGRQLARHDSQPKEIPMRILKLAGALIAVLALTAVATATASATEILWPWLPGAEGTKFTGKSAKATLQIKGSGSITCAESSAEGEIQKEKTLGLAVINFGKACTIAGLPVNSLGDASGTILVHVEIHNCLIATGRYGLLIKVLPLHLEIPSTKLLLSVEGALIAEVTPANKKAAKFNLVVEQKEGKQTIEKCEGGTAQTLLTSLDGGEFKVSAEEAKEGTITFTTEQEVMS